MWPMRSEMTRDECRKCLRCLELDAYGSMVSVLRAQGPFTNEKQKLLQELAKVLHISNERHRAEIRRAVNDEKLATIAEQLNGPNTGIDWTLEGRRSIPLLPRLKARSAFTTLANSLSLTTAIANNKKPDRCNTVRQSGNSTAAETESHPSIKIEEGLSVESKLNSLENYLDNSKTSQENSNLIENETIDNKDVLDKVTEKPKESSRKRKSPSPLPTAPPNKVLVISEPPNHISRTSENKQSQVLQVTKHQNFALIKVNETSDSVESTTVSEHPSECTTVSLNKHVIVTTTSVCTNRVSNPKMAVSTDQNKINTKVLPAISSCILNINKVHSSKDTQPQDSTNGTQKTQPDNTNSILSDNVSSNPSTTKSCMTLCDPIIQNYTRMTSARLTQSMPVYPGTTVSSGPGPPQVKQVPITLMCTKLPSEQIVTFDQSTAKTGIFPKKVINMPHYTNTKLNKANVIVIQKAKSVTLSHAGKEVLGKVIMEGKNLCVTSQHNANSINVQPHHISLNNGDQTKTMLPIANSPQNAESIKTNIKSGKATVVSVTRFRHDVQENKVLSQLFDSPAICNVEKSKTLIQDINACLPKEECNSDKNTTDRESSLKTDSMITSTSEETQHRSVQSNSNNIEHRKNNDVNVSINSQDTNLLESSKLLESKEILVRSKQVHDDIEDDVRIEKPDENVDTFNATSESINKNLQSFQYLVDNDENHDLEKSLRSMVTVNQMDEHDDS
ncbi:BRCA2-interacting transcriptional repressor EMSY isoform X2 [Mycetomoellerius zeteki]|uniref:BRCA2-interacting transcriptional repressor EMSY isoform X2 n=1 Tax=Mycetomoellerius zeteki TaxID=64791 RepID=UPI00084E4878|nr:PREDICTED: BRCA2-interacting transcriptional repressor EMSY isoform X2 [Trachymyrmex zeteki]